MEKVIDFYLKKLTKIENLEIACFALKVSPDIKNGYQGKIIFKELKIPRINPLFNHLCFFAWASLIVRFSKFDVYYSHFPILNFGKKLVYHVHSVHKSAIWAIEKGSGFWGKLRYCLRRYYPLPIILEKMAFRFHKKNKFIAVSSKIKNEIIKEYGVPAEFIHVIPAPINLDEFFFQNRDLWKSESRGKYDFFQRQNWFWLGTVLNRLAGKNIHLALTALAASSRNIGLVIVGLPKKKDLIKLRRWLKDFHLENKVFLIGSRPNIEKIYPIFDFFILPSLYESFGLSVIESLLMGTPAIVSKEIGCLEFIPAEVKKEMIIEIGDIQCKMELTDILRKISPVVMAEKDGKLAALTEHLKGLNEEGWARIKNLLNL